MGWSTTVVSPPDGDMAAYMASLDLLLDRDDAVYYPAHGPAVEKPHSHVRGLIAHRRMREQQILRAARRGRGAHPGDGRRHVPRRRSAPAIRAAGRSVLAHLVDLEARGLVRGEGEAWTLAA